jgi:hypothetical protein
MTRAWAVAVVLGAAAMAAGCGSGGGGTTERTDASCMAYTGQICNWAHTDFPTEISCDGGLEVDECPATGVLATCTADVSFMHTVIYVYDAAALADTETQCTALGGDWLTYSN